MAKGTKNWDCQSGKRRYDTKDEAFKEIFALIEESFGGMTFLRPYRCKFCKGYHLTSSDK